LSKTFITVLPQQQQESKTQQSQTFHLRLHNTPTNFFLLYIGTDVLQYETFLAEVGLQSGTIVQRDCWRGQKRLKTPTGHLKRL